MKNLQINNNQQFSENETCNAYDNKYNANQNFEPTKANPNSFYKVNKDGAASIPHF